VLIRSAGHSPPTHRRGGAGRSDRGSVLMLMPAGVLIVLLLAAITVDLTYVRVGQRELIAAAGDAANDATAFGLDESALRRGDGYALDPGRAHQAVVASLTAKGLLDDLAAPPAVDVAADGTVEVRLVRRVPHIFGRALPGSPDDTEVRATASARLEVR
jgi:hypothetical protein